jgi:hypothetical protein
MICFTSWIESKTADESNDRLFRRYAVKRVNQNWLAAREFALKHPVDLAHVDSQWCWCEPVEQLDETGEQVLIHREVTWN